MSLSRQDRARISTAIRAGEARTSGEIVCVLAVASTPATAAPIFVAAPLFVATLVALALPWLLVAFTAMPVYRMLSLQVAVFAVLALLLGLPRVRAVLVPRRLRRAVAHRAALEQFTRRGVARTADRTGILIFVSLAERYARIVADDGIAARVPQAEWQATVDALIAHMRDGRIADGFIVAIDKCGGVLATHFPASAKNPDELPDRIYEI